MQIIKYAITTSGIFSVAAKFYLTTNTPKGYSQSDWSFKIGDAYKFYSKSVVSQLCQEINAAYIKQLKQQKKIPSLRFVVEPLQESLRVNHFF